MNAGIRIVGWDPRHAAAFRDLNLEWLERYFVVEPVDREVLDNPQRLIIDAGGEILFAVDGEGGVLGTCALLRVNDDEVELTKMAVTSARQGAGIGRRLIDAAIECFRQMPGDTLFLETNSSLVAAVTLLTILTATSIPNRRGTAPAAKAGARRRNSPR